MKFLVAVWVIVMALLGTFGIIHANDTDKNGNYKINWRMLLMFAMLPITPIVAYSCGLI